MTREATAQEQTEAVLAAAISEIGGQQRSGQVQLATEVGAALDTGVHLLAQAGTGTGKSLGYLAPVLVRLARGDLERVVVTTATLALQSQLARKDIPSAIAAVEQVLGRRPTVATLKGRSNYACLLKVHDGVVGGTSQEALISAADLFAGAPAAVTSAKNPESALAAEVLALREWAGEQAAADELADRDDAPTHTERGWRQVSMPARECLGVQRCPQGSQCLVERSRELARNADLVLTNHALLAIDAMQGGTALPSHEAVIVDEAHELTERVTSAASAELTAGMVAQVGRRALPWLDDDDLGVELLDAVEAFESALDGAPLQQLEDPGSELVGVCELLRSVLRRIVSALTTAQRKNEPECRQASAAAKEILEIAERTAALSEHDVVWVAESERAGRDRSARTLRVAPLTVSGLIRSAILGSRTTILTSATLKLGGEFAGTARAVGLRLDDEARRLPAGDQRSQPEAEGSPARSDAKSTPAERASTTGSGLTGLGLTGPDGPSEAGSAGPTGETPESERQLWRGVDVGSPFAYDRQGILYLARRLPPPGRDGISEAVLAEIAELVWAAGGRTLGLFSSRRAAETAAAWVRQQLPKLPVLCQGDAQLSELTRRFIAEPSTSLFGTLSLWQGIDVPGSTCRLVVLDRIPFPRPDEPLTVARQRAVTAAGGNAFMTIAASQAALLLAQGAGRLIRRTTDRGVVAVLDPRLQTARYGSYLLASMPPMWQTGDRETAIGALRRLAAAD